MDKNMFKRTLELVAKNWGYVLLLCLISIPIFAQLGTFPLRIWDEARLADNAYEMYHNGNLITTYAEGTPDLWNTKPPLMIWLQTLSMKVFGINEFAIRFPSALTALLTCAALLIFSVRYVGSFWFGFITVLVLMTSQGYVGEHAIRTGDYDALLTLFTTVSCLSFFAFTETYKNKYLYLFFLFMALAILTKSIVGLMFLPAIFVYVLFRRQLIAILKNPHFYFGLLVFVVITIGYYLLREFDNPGYINAVFENELDGRYLKTVDAESFPFRYYFDTIGKVRFTNWILILPCGALLGLLSKNSKIWRVSLFSLLVSIFFYFIISCGDTKHLWYDVPMYPFLSILVAIFIFYIFDLFTNIHCFSQNLKYHIIPFIFLFLIFITPYSETVKRITTPFEDMYGIYSMGYYLRDIKEKPNENINICYDGHFVQNLFYLNILQKKGFDICRTDWKSLKVEDVVIANQDEVKDYIERNYNFEILEEFYNLKKYRIIINGIE